MIKIVWLAVVLFAHDMNATQKDYCDWATVPELIRLIADNLVVSCEREETVYHKDLLVNIYHFSRTSKKIYGVVHNDLYGDVDKARVKEFNELLINVLTKKSFRQECFPHTLAFAYMATPYTVQKLEKELNKVRYFDILQLLAITVPSHKFQVYTSFDDSYDLENQESFFHKTIEESYNFLQEGLKVFPNATQHCCLKIWKEKNGSKQDLLLNVFSNDLS